MDLKLEDFKLLRYNCYPLPPSKNLLEEFPELGRFPEFIHAPNGIDHNKVIRYIIYCYDKRSPLLSEKNLVKRKMLACKTAGFEFEQIKPTAGRPPDIKPTPEYSHEVEEMIRGKNADVNRMICRYCRNQSDLTYSLLVAGMESFFDNITKLSAPLEGNDMQELNKRVQLYQQLVTMINSFETNADETFKGDIQLIYEADLIEQEETGKIKSYPEHIASLRENGELQKTFENLS